MSWPTLSRRPISEQHIGRDNVIKNEAEEGTLLRRKRFTRNRLTFALTYDMLSTTDANLIIALWDSNNLHTTFSWTDKHSVTRDVFFNANVAWVETIPGWYTFETFNFIEE